MVELGARRGALLLAIEHRYYGPSNPFPGNFSTPNLLYLSTEQALEDISSFHGKMSALYGLTSTNKWVTWGGSYPGMLAALSRLQFPTLFHASIASSAPLEAAINFPGYNNVVAESMSNPLVGGSQQCLAVIVDGHRQINEQLQLAVGRRFLENMFNLCSPNSLEEQDNRYSFAGDGVVYFPVQSNDPSCSSPLCDIASICSFLTSSAAPSAMQTLADLSRAMSGGTCVTANFATYLKASANEKNSGRAWNYQTCTQWGFYQTCEVGSDCPYSQGLHTLDIDMRICAAAFSLSQAQVEGAISLTNPRYGGRQIQGSRIMFPNGEVDPWKAGGVLVPPTGSQQEPVLMIAGASHHFWTHPSLASDSKQVNDSRRSIWDQTDAWLAEA